jgi:callose synthase
MVVYSACEDIGNFFGFQDSSVRNQAEHLLVLLSNKRRYMTTAEGANPISILHKKTFGNYVEWCRSVGATPGFSKGNVHLAKAPPMMHARIVDLVLYFCIWGEGANLRHMPECLCFLYHKMHEAYSRSDRIAHQTRSLYPGHFLDNVVSPLYQIVAKNMKSKADHDNRKNYDDFNEFFWSSKCLRYHYRQLSNDVDSMMESGVIGDEVRRGQPNQHMHSNYYIVLYNDVAVVAPS